MNQVLNYLAIFISLSTATGVFLHEARIDRVTGASSMMRTGFNKIGSVKKTGTNANPSDVDFSAHPHTHPEHSAKTLRGFSYKSPAVHPREQKMKKHLMQNIEPRGRHAFDNHHLPIIA